MGEYKYNKDIKIKVPGDVAFIIELLENAGYEAYAVGGCIRDTMLGRKPQDWDITTSALPKKVKEIFHKTIDTGIKHGTVTVRMHGKGYEVTTYRIDGEYEDSRHPESVEFTTNLVEDLKRRDFTINALAYNPKRGLVDVFDGIGDMRRSVIRCVGNAEERFSEDALRILRAVRFSAQLGFEIDEDTVNGAKKLAHTLVNISRERICAELEKILTSNHPEKMRDAYFMGMTKWVMPEFDKMMECAQNSKYHSYNVGEHTIRVMQGVGPDHYLRWAALLHDVGKPCAKTTDGNGTDHFYGHAIKGKAIAELIMKELKMDNKTIKTVGRLVECHDMIYRIPATEHAVRKSINKIGNDIYPMMLELVRADAGGKSDYGREVTQDAIQYVSATYTKIIERGDCYCTAMLALAGRDLIAMGVGPGPIIGDILDHLLTLVLERPELNTREQLENIVKKKWIDAG